MAPKNHDGPAVLNSMAVESPTADALFRGAGGYAAEKAADGTWTIRDVPIFAVHEDPRSGKTFSRRWLEKSIKKAASRRAEGYLPPLHIRHHGDEGVRAAGHFVPTRVESQTYEGKPTDTLLADLVRVPGEIYAEIKAGRLPYVSVEILDTRKAELDSLALLDRDVPFFRWPLLNITSESKAASATANTNAELFRLCRQNRPALAYSAAGHAAAVLLRFQEAPMAKTFALDEAQTAAAEAMAKFTEVVAAVTGALEEAAGQLGIGNGEEASEEAPAEAPEEEPAEEEMAAASPVDFQDDDEEDEEKKKLAAAAHLSAGPPEFAAMAGQLAALQAKLDARDNDDLVNAAVDTTLSQLATFGVTPAARPELKKIASGPGGEAALAAYAAAVQSHGVQEPPAGWSGELPKLDGVIGGQPIVEKYGEQGPDALAHARELEASYNAMPSGMRGSQTLESFISVNFEADKANGTIARHAPTTDNGRN